MKFFVEMEFGRRLMLGLLVLLFASAAPGQPGNWPSAAGDDERKGTSPPIGISLGAVPSVIDGGGVSTVTVTVANTIGGPVPTFQLDGTLQGNVARKGFIDGSLEPPMQTVPSLVDGGTGPDWFCNDMFGTFTCSPIGGTLPAGTSVFSFDLQAFSKGTGGTLEITMTDPDFTANTGNVSIVLLGFGPADLELTDASMNPANPAPNSPVDIQFTVTNQNPANAGGSFALDLSNSPGFSLPAGGTFGNFDCTGTGTLNCVYSGPGLLPGQSATLTVPAVAPFGGQPFSTDASLTSQVGDNIVPPGVATAAGDTGAVVDSFASGPVNEPVPYGAPMVYSITVDNSGPAPAQNVTFLLQADDDLFSATAVFQSFSGTNWSCSEGFPAMPKSERQTSGRKGGAPALNVNCTYGVILPAGQSASPLTIAVLAPTAAGVTQLTAFPSASADNQTNFPSPSSIITGVAPTSDMSITKSAPASVVVSSTFDYTLTITNGGPNDIAVGDYFINDMLPPEVSFVGFTNADYSCFESTGVVSCSYTGTAPTRPSGTTDVIDITVQANSTGNVSNNASLTVNLPTVDPNGANNTDSVNVNITPPDTDLSMTKNASVAAAVINDQFTYDLIVTNNGPLVIDKALYTITDTLPAEVAFVSAGNPSYTCNEVTGVVTCSYTDSPSDLLVGGSDTITLTVNALTAANTTNTADVAPLAPFIDSNAANNSDSVNVNIALPDTDLSMTKNASVTSASVNDQFTYDLMVTNNGPLDIDKALYLITDTLPAEVAFVSAGNPDYTCIESAGVVTCSYSGPRASLVTGTSDTIPLTVLAVTPGNASNTADVAPDSSFADTNSANNTDTADVMIAGSADLGMTKSASALNVDQGSSFTYTLTVDNAGPNEPPFFTVVDTLPPEVSYDGFTATDFTCVESANVVTCDFTGSSGLLVGATTSIDINVTAQGDGNAVNNASVAVAAPDTDPNTGNDSDSVSVSINPQADLSLAKSATVSTATVGDRFDWIVDVTNNGPGFADQFTVTDTLPSQTGFESLDAPDFDCAVTGQIVTCDWLSLGKRKGLGQLPPAGTSQIVITVSADTPGTATNSANVSPDGSRPDLNLTNNADTATVVISAPPMTTLVTTTSDDPDPVAVAGDFQLAATITNQGPSAASNLFATFFLADGVTFNGAEFNKGQASGWSCFDNAFDKGTILFNSIDCTNPGPVAVNESTTILLNLTAPPTPGVISTDIEIGSDEFGPARVTETTAVGLDVDLTVSKEATQNQVDVNEEFSYRISVTNNAGFATGVVVSDTISNDLAVNGIVGGDWRCEQFQSTYQCAYLPGSLAAGETTSLLRFNVQAVRAAEIDNTARVSSDQNDLAPGDNTATATVIAGDVDVVDLALTKASLPPSVAAGTTYQYLLTVENNGTVAANGVTIIDRLPAGVQFNSASGSGWTCMDLGGSMVQCDLAGTLLPATEVSSSNLTLEVTAPFLIGTVVNTADVSSDEFDIDTTDNNASAATTIFAAGPTADLSIAKSVDRASARRGDLLTYTIDVLNLGADTAAGVSIQDSLPGGVEVRDVIAPNWDCVVTIRSVSCQLMADLPSGEGAGLMFTSVVTTNSGQVLNQASVFADTNDPNPDNNLAAATTSVTGDALPADLGLDLNDTADPVLTGDNFDYLITLFNQGPGGATEFAISGQLPPGIVAGAIVDNDAVDCAIEGGLLVCRSVGIFGPDQERQIRFSVTAPGEATDLSFTVEVQNTGLGIDVNPANNSATETTTVRVTPTAQQLQDQLISALSGFDDPLVTENLVPTANLCADPPPDLIELCRAIADALDDGRGGEVADVIRALTGAPALTQHTALVEAYGVLFTNMANRFSQNRQSNGQANAGTFNMDGLSFRYGNEVLPFSLLDDGSDEATIDSSGLVKPWAFFVNGTISGGEKDPSTREVGFDFDTRGLTFGVDYRFSTRFIGGAAVGYSSFESDIQGGGELQTDGLLLHLFANYYPSDRMYIDGLISFGSVDFDQTRPISFTIGNLVVQERAVGSTESDQLSGALAMGYNFNRDAWNITPSASLSFMDADIDSFVETGTSLGLTYSEQNVESLIFSANLNVSRVISLTRGILTPTFDLAWHHESQNDKDGFNSTILGAPINASFVVDGDDPDRNYGSAGLGLVFVAANGRQAFLSYRNVLGLNGFSRWTLNAGVRFEF